MDFSHKPATVAVEANDEELISKSERKRRVNALQELAEMLSEAPSLWPNLELPELMVQSLKELKTMKRHEAIRRQRQFLGKQMRELSPEMHEKIQKAVRQHPKFQAQFKREPRKSHTRYH